MTNIIRATTGMITMELNGYICIKEYIIHVTEGMIMNCAIIPTITVMISYQLSINKDKLFMIRTKGLN